MFSVLWREEELNSYAEEKSTAKGTVDDGSIYGYDEKDSVWRWFPMGELLLCIRRRETR